MVVDPLGRFVYVANTVSNASALSTISMYKVNASTGVLTPTVPATVPAGWYPQEIAIDPLGRFVYTANSDDSTVSMFTINQTTGVLTPTTPAAVSTVVNGEPYAQPMFLTEDPGGKYLYVTESITNGSVILMYSIDQTTGFLTPLAPAYVYTGGYPWQIKVTSNGKFAYVVDNDGQTGYELGVWQFIVDSATGVLTPNATLAVATGNGPTEITIDPSSKFAYVVNRLDNTVSMYTIDPTSGNLALNATATNPTATISTGIQPFRISFDASGQFVYVTNEQSMTSIYTVNADGTLSNTGTSGTPGFALTTTFPYQP